METSLKACWTVTAGLSQLPNQEIKELSKTWYYTGLDFDADQECKPGESIFLKRKAEAMEYASSLQDPTRLNYVKLEFLWL